MPLANPFPISRNSLLTAPSLGNTPAIKKKKNPSFGKAPISKKTNLLWAGVGGGLGGGGVADTFSKLKG